MRFARLATTAALIVAVPVALSAPAHAASKPLDSAATVGVSPMIAALSQYLKLPPEQALARWKRERQAARTNVQLKRQLGRTFVGSWLSGDGQLNVAISDPGKAAMVRAAGALPEPVSPKSAVALSDAVKLLTTSQRPAGFVSWYPNRATGSLVVNVKPGTEATARKWLKKHLGTTPFAMGTVTDAARPTAQFLRGGTTIGVSGGTCSMGFAVEGGFVTAGHCGKAGDSVRTRAGAGEPIGKFESSVSGPEGDFAFVKTVPGWTLMAEVFKFDGSKTVHVNGSDEAPVGATVCRSGQTTHWHCGKITAKDGGAATNTESSAVGGLTQTDACAERGDSGGPFITDDGQAQGILFGSGVDTHCGKTTGNFSFFQPINEVLQKNNLKLLTENQAPPWEPDFGSSPCC